ncbi:hypothetical protein KA062_01275 [Patescibacteria group bacterium]|nr:hypothetical protein [Patescibacteria group bacterium]
MSEKNERPTWDEFWFQLALLYSTRATCDRLRTATVIVKNNRQVGAGYNGSVPGADHCDDVGHLIINGHCERTLHGEQNAIINSTREGLLGSTAYILGSPCLRCFKELVAAGVVEIKCLGTYGNSLGKDSIFEIALQTGVSIKFFNYDPRGLIESAIRVLERKGGRLYKES